MTAMDFRQYDNALGRFHGVDLLAESDYSGSPYSFSFNNPVYFSDPSGLTPQEGDQEPPKDIAYKIELVEVVIVRPKKTKVISDGVDNGGAIPNLSFPIQPDYIGFVGGGGGRNEIGVTMSALGLVALNTALIEGARMKNYVSSGIDNFSNGFADGFAGGVDGTISFFVSLGTQEGWIAIGNGFSAIGYAACLICPEGSATRNQMLNAPVNYVKNVPNMSAYEIGYDLGFGTEKAFEFVLTKQIYAGAGIGFGDVRFLSNTTLRGTTLFKTGKNFRIDLDLKNKLHYHRRGPGGIGRHRPWQVKPGDKGNFWNRF